MDAPPESWMYVDDLGSEERNVVITGLWSASANSVESLALLLGQPWEEVMYTKNDICLSSFDFQDIHGVQVSDDGLDRRVFGGDLLSLLLGADETSQLVFRVLF